MLNQFKNFNADGMNLEDLMALSAFGRCLQAEYEKLQVPAPEYVEVNMKALRREVRSRNTDRLQKQLKEAQLQLENLKTPAEKKAELRRKVQSIEEQLEEVA